MIREARDKTCFFRDSIDADFRLDVQGLCVYKAGLVLSNRKHEVEGAAVFLGGSRY